MKKLLLVGAGGTGSHFLAPGLTYLKTFYGNADPNVWQFGVMDGDDVEGKNLERQLFDPSLVHLNKAKASLYPYPSMTNLIAIPEYLGTDNISRYITEDMTVLIAVDNFPVRALIEDHCLNLNNVAVINGGNEIDTGSCQIWIRQDGKNITPPISFLHPEIRRPGIDRAELSCQQIAELPGGEQLIVTNMSSAMYMLLALMAVNVNEVKWTEVQFSLTSIRDTYEVDNRQIRGWN